MDSTAGYPLFGSVSPWPKGHGSDVDPPGLFFERALLGVFQPKGGLRLSYNWNLGEFT